MCFNGKVVVITGAAAGIGASTAIHFAKLQASLVLVDVNKTKLKETGDECDRKSNNNAYLITADMSIEDDIRKVISNTLDRFGQIDVLVNNAGVSSRSNIFKENFLENYDWTFNINLKAPMLLTHLAAPHLMKTKGNIINLTSVGGIHPLPDLMIYNASKAALRHFTKNVAFELAPKGVRVNGIAPAGVKTEMVRSAGVTDLAEFEKRRAKQLPLQHMVEPTEVAGLIAFLASDKACSITGAEYVIDAGHLLGGGTPKYN